ncbi:PIN/TRAM domain-containing protein [Paenibacillus flagellatus]|uniref:Twitching motility protein PilT n=1 Tax=Paenibacillus flagellatus TaxID=2211139 RepID=A0A2V5JU65_9BACL|nr:PIN/TRAM domain-containing protein [Paenibacillus flagellatus]PYI50165.1 twitching motility protein PilT [Paenibacillus flagellatus]
MAKRQLQLLLTLAGGLLGYWRKEAIEQFLLPIVGPLFGIDTIPGMAYWAAFGCAAIVMAASAWLLGSGFERIRDWEDRVAKTPSLELFSGLAGLLLGLVIAALLFPTLARAGDVGTLLAYASTAFLGVSGFRIGYKKREDLVHVATFGFGDKKKKGAPIKDEHKILDTSVIIDGRIADICKTGFIEGTLVIPEFVLEELQHIADSSDLLKRNRGRRGLDILNKIQKELDVKVLIYEGDFEEISEVDSKLVRLAKALQGKVITNDFNLNKVCELQGVSVLNINDLANAVKPVVLPGEEILVQVIKDGKEHGQGVAYLDDGTMIVVEGGREYIGATIEVLVTSVLQTSAGRMIFAKPKLLEKAL